MKVKARGRQRMGGDKPRGKSRRLTSSVGQHA